MESIYKFLLFSFTLFVSVFSATIIEKIDINDRPIIGILSQEFDRELFKNDYPGLNKSYIAASYVKYLESAGARVVPIRIAQPESYYENIMSKINGVLFPGGDSDFNNTNGFADAGEIIYRIAEKFNHKGDYFPIWGTCLGFELLTYLAANRSEHRVRCDSNNQTLPLEFTSHYNKSKMFKNAPQAIVDILREENVTVDFHSFCTTDESLAKVNLQDTFRIISYNHDINGIKFISALEHVKIPFFAVQFHPEKNNFEYVKNENNPHSSNAIRISQYFANFFVNEARKSQHSFSDENEENQQLIYNSCPIFTYLKGIIFEQTYFL